MKLYVRIGLVLLAALVLSLSPLAARAGQITVLTGDQILNAIPAETLANAGVDVTRQTGVEVILPVKAFQSSGGDLWLEYPEVLPKTGEPIYYNLKTGRVGNASSAGIAKAGALATAVLPAMSDCVGTYVGTVKASVSGSKWGIKIKGDANVNCTLKIDTLALSSKKKLYVKGSFTCSGTAKILGVTKTIDIKMITFDQSSAKTKISTDNGNYKLEYETKFGDLKLTVSVLLNGATASGKGKLSGKYSGISVKGDGSMLLTKQQ